MKFCSTTMQLTSCLPSSARPWRARSPTSTSKPRSNAFWVARTDALIAEVEEHLDAGLRASHRGGTTERQHLYRLDALTVSLTVDSIDRRVAGRIEGAGQSARWLDAGGSSRPLELDDNGCFRVTPQSGPASVEVVLVDGRRVRTAWTLL